MALHWYKLAESPEELPWASNGLLEVELGGKRVCLARVEAGLRACAAKCPHAGGRMADGYVNALGHIVCPLHRYRFSLERGQNVSGEGYFLKTYPVELREDGVYIGLERGGWLNP